VLKRTMKRATATAVVATAGVIGLGSAAGAHSPDTHVVQPGDTLFLIAGHNWGAVAEANGIANPNLIYPGQEIVLGATGSGSSSSSSSSSSSGASYAPVEAPVEAPAEAPAPAPAPEPAPAPAATSGGSGVWDQLAQCESGCNLSINTGNGYYGGLQFSQSSWEAAGGSGSPANASRSEQIRVAENLQGMQGWGAWPACSSKLGLR
jgi:LysM repeat protein